MKVERLARKRARRFQIPLHDGSERGCNRNRIPEWEAGGRGGACLHSLPLHGTTAWAWRRIVLFDSLAAHQTNLPCMYACVRGRAGAHDGGPTSLVYPASRERTYLSGVRKQPLGLEESHVATSVWSGSESSRPRLGSAASSSNGPCRAVPRHSRPANHPRP